jgi:hypothetical protein
MWAVMFGPGSHRQQIEESTFAGCSSLQSIVIPASVRVLCRYCFSGCRSLSSVVFEANSHLERIEESAFCDCSCLQSICIPASVVILGQWCFAHCTSLASFTFEFGSKLDRIEGNVFSRCSSLKTVFVPRGVHVCESNPNVRQSIPLLPDPSSAIAQDSVCDDFYQGYNQCLSDLTNFL